MNELRIFENAEFGSVRVVERDGEPWFVAKEVADILGYVQTQNMRSVIDEEEFVSISQGELSASNPVPIRSCYNGNLINTGVARLLLISEAGLYQAIMRSTKPNAKPFRKWVTREVIPSIRKHGAYIVPDTLEQMLSNPDALIAILTKLKEEQQAKAVLEDKVVEDAPKVEFYDAVTGSSDVVDMASVAKVLNIKGMGRTNLFEFLRDNRVLQQNNQPYQKYIDNGWLRVVETMFTKPTGDTCINLKTVVYQKGVDGIRKMLQKGRKK